jgi:hypothetical protein
MELPCGGTAIETTKHPGRLCRCAALGPFVVKKLYPWFRGTVLRLPQAGKPRNNFAAIDDNAQI